MTTLTTYKFTRGITKILQSVREGDEVIVTCEGKEPVVVHKYTGEPCTAPMVDAMCAVPACAARAAHMAGDIPICSVHFDMAKTLAAT